jgi:hypothetical protein
MNERIAIGGGAQARESGMIGAAARTWRDRPDLLYGEIKEDLRSTVRALLAERSPWQAVLARTEQDETTDLKLWRALASELGCAGLLVPAGGALYLVPTGADTGDTGGSGTGSAGGSVVRAAVTSLDMTRQLCDVTFRSATFPEPGAAQAGNA